MSFGDLFRPLKQWNKSSYKVSIAKEKKVKAIAPLPKNSRAVLNGSLNEHSNDKPNTPPRYNTASDASTNLNGSAKKTIANWERPSLVLHDLAQRIHRLIEEKQIEEQCNILDLSCSIDPSVFSWFNQTIANEVPMKYKVESLWDSHLSSEQLAALDNDHVDYEIPTLKNLYSNKSYKADIILAWNFFQYCNEAQVKNIIKQLMPLCKPTTLIYINSCQYLSTKKSFSLDDSKQKNIAKSPLVSFKVSSTNSNDNRCAVNLIANHNDNEAMGDSNHYSLGSISSLLGSFEIIKVNNHHNPEFYESIARLS